MVRASACGALLAVSLLAVKVAACDISESVDAIFVCEIIGDVLISDCEGVYGWRRLHELNH